MIAAWRIYRKGMVRALSMAEAAPALHRIVYNKFYVDEIYHRFIVAPLKGTALLFNRFDQRVIDGLVNLAAKIVEFLGIVVRVTQTGVVHTYAFWFILGALAVLWMIYRPL